MAARPFKFSTSGHDYEQPLLLLWFSASWCGPCMQFIPAMNEIAKLHQREVQVVKIDVDDFHDLATDFGVRAVPTLKLMKKNGVADSQTGVMTVHALSQWLQPHLDNQD